MRPGHAHPRIVVFSDLDPVLRDPHQPPFLAAAQLLEPLTAADVAIVLCSNKTRPELDFIRDRLGLRDPFICEHGGAVMVPGAYGGWDLEHARDVAGYQAIEFGRPYRDVVGALHRTADRLKIEVGGFSDMSIDTVARWCQVPLMQARLAKLRDYTEPFRIIDDQPHARRRLFNALAAVPLACTAGDRMHLVGAPVDSRIGVNLLTNLYRRGWDAVRTVGITRESRHDTIVSTVDVPIVLPGEDTSECTLGIVDWAALIVGVARRLLGADRLSAPVFSSGK